MLATRKCNPFWQTKTLDYDVPDVVSRMSNSGQLSAHQGWRETYQQYVASDSPVLLPPFESISDVHDSQASYDQSAYGKRPLSPYASPVKSETIREQPRSPVITQPGSLQPTDVTPSFALPMIDETSGSTNRGLEASSHLSTASTERPRAPDEPNTQHSIDEGESYEEPNDLDMLEAEHEPPVPRSAQTDAERRAAMRKMKRFRLTHQQTRFLMSEFAKQAHPDAAHRERLSKEIPGLSPRQVQVWFQNRRAKIKRLNVDDRERMMRMRAVPEGFDSVQALHSPYGALQGGASHAPQSTNYSQHGYADASHHPRPLMADLGQRMRNDRLITTTSSPSFSGMGYAPTMARGMSAYGSLQSTTNFPSHNRQFSAQYASPLSNMSTAGEISNRSQAMQGFDSQLRSAPQSLQPLQPSSTQRPSDTSQRSLRPSTHWKSNSVDYSSLFPTHLTPSSASGATMANFYTPGHAESRSEPRAVYDSNPFDDSGTINISPQQPTYQKPEGATVKSPLQPQPFPNFHNSTSSSNLTGTSDTLRDFRTIPPVNTHGHAYGAINRSMSYSSALSSGGYNQTAQSAPLTAPPEYRMPKTPIEEGSRGFHHSQLSAPIIPPQDFGEAYRQNEGLTGQQPQGDDAGGLQSAYHPQQGQQQQRQAHHGGQAQNYG